MIILFIQLIMLTAAGGEAVLPKAQVSTNQRFDPIRIR